MITVGDKTIKLQIWDTVNVIALRPDSSPASRSRAGTTDRPRVPFWSTISPTASLIRTCRVGCKRRRSMETLRCVLWWWVTNATWNLSNKGAMKA